MNFDIKDIQILYITIEKIINIDKQYLENPCFKQGDGVTAYLFLKSIFFMTVLLII